MILRSRFPVVASLLSFSLGIVVGITGSASAGLLGSTIFPDLQSGTFYDEAVGEMYSEGIIRGYESGKFGPNDYVTRGQLAVMMKRLRDDLLGVDIATPALPSSSSSSSQPRSSSSSSAAAVETIQNPAGSVRFTASTYDVEEDAGVATISVIRAGGNQGAATVDYAVTDGTALRDTDYVITSGTLSFADGETSKTFAVQILNDPDSEEDETVNLEISLATGGMDLGSPKTAVLTITDDDTAAASPTTSPSGALGFSALEYAAAENGGTITITVERSGGSQGAVTVGYATSNGSANSNSDYTFVSGTLSFAAGETTKTFSVSVTDDATIDGNKTVNLALSGPTGGAILGTTASAVLTIMDNETVTFGSGSFRFNQTAYDVLETDGQVLITVKRMGGSNGAATVKYEASNGTAVAGSDYTATAGTLTFAHGEATKTFTVAITKDTVADSDETVNLLLKEPTGGALGSPTTATITIY